MIGEPVSRLDGPLKVRGAAALRGRVPAGRACSTPRSCIQHDRARAASPALDTAAAEAAPGVALVMTHRNAPRMKPPPAVQRPAEGGAAARPADHAGRPRSTGTAQPIAVVLAETQEQADHARSLIRVDL